MNPCLISLCLPKHKTKMDCSNPVADSTRIALSTMRLRRERIVRQNLHLLEKALVGKSRVLYEALPQLELEEGWETATDRIARDYSSALKERMKNASPKEDINKVCDLLDPTPVCALLVDNLPVHPPGVNESGGNVYIHQTFGGVTIDTHALRHIALHFGSDAATSILEGCSPYSQGTKAGFYNRCVKQLGRTCVQITSLYTATEFHTAFDRALPVQVSSLPNWGNALDSQMDMLKTSFTSSAGAPYWRSKLDSIDLMQNAVLPLVLDHIMAGTLSELYKRQPELWLCQLKNKADRYKDPVEKTRPYLSLPWHWQALFSCLSQPYSDSLKLFYEQDGCRNAYGFSYANGGGNKLRAHVIKELSKKDYTFFVYGDDVDFYYKDHDGSIMRLCPDFSQMDGSVDRATISMTIDHILAKFAEAHGEDNLGFWQVVASQWKHFATRPYMVLDGTTTYRKRQADGLMTGVVGTTLFDTVKAILVYERFVEHLKDHPSALGKTQAAEWFAAQGLTIKEGTWSPQKVQVEPVSGALWTNQKFLGMQLKYVRRDQEYILVPVLPRDDWLSLYLTPRRDNLNTTTLARQRYTFDRMRGLLTTGAIFDEEVRRLFNGLMRGLDPLAIVMQVQAGEGRGASPELVNVTGKDFQYATSMGWPTLEWALDLYSENKQNTPMGDVFVGGEEQFRAVHSRPQRPLELKVVDRVSAFEPTEALLVAEVATPSFSVPLDSSLMVHKKEDVVLEKHNKRSEIKDLAGIPAPKRMPRLTEVIVQLMEPRHMEPPADARMQLLSGFLSRDKPAELAALTPRQNPFEDSEAYWQVLNFIAEYRPSVLRQDDWGELFSNMVWPLHKMAALVGVAADRLEKEVRALGYLVLGPPTNKFVTNKAWAGVPAKLVSQVKRQEGQLPHKLQEARKELKDATVEKVPALKVKVKALEANVKRAAEAPAIGLVAEPPKLPTLKRIPNFEPDHASIPSKLAAQSNTILKSNGMLARLVVSNKPEGPLYTFLITHKNVEREYLRIANRSAKDAWISFHLSIVQRYIKDTQIPKVNENWADHMDKVDEQNVRIYKDSVGPLFMQRRNEPLQLLREISGVEVVEGPDGPLVTIGKHGDMKVLALRKGTVKSRAARLAKLFGEEIQVESMPLSAFHELSQLNKRKRQQNAPKAQKQADKGRAAGRSDIGGNAPVRPTEKEAPPPRITEKRRDPRDRGAPSQRERLFRGNPDKVYRPNWIPQRPSGHKSRRVGRNPRAAGSPTVAKVEAGKSPN